jgi:hypothetical protein
VRERRGKPYLMVVMMMMEEYLKWDGLVVISEQKMRLQVKTRFQLKRNH